MQKLSQFFFASIFMVTDLIPLFNPQPAEQEQDGYCPLTYEGKEYRSVGRIAKLASSLKYFLLEGWEATQKELAMIKFGLSCSEASIKQTAGMSSSASAAFQQLTDEKAAVDEAITNGSKAHKAIMDVLIQTLPVRN